MISANGRQTRSERQPSARAVAVRASSCPTLTTRMTIIARPARVTSERKRRTSEKVATAMPGSEAQVEPADGERSGTDVESVVVAVLIALTLEVEAVEGIAADDLEADVSQIEPHAAVDAHLAIEDLVVLVAAVGPVEVIAVPLVAHVRPQRTEDLPGGARAHRPERIVFGVERELLPRLVPDERE